MIFNAREELAMYETLIGAMRVDDKGFSEVVKEYEKARFPFVEQTKDKESKTAEQVLEKAFMEGPMVLDRRNEVKVNRIRETK